MKLPTVSVLVLAISFQGAIFLAGCGLVPAPQSGIMGKWRNADNTYVVEFLPSGNCSAHYRMQGREVGGACTYTFDKDDITLRYPNMQAGAPNNSATWHYTLAGDVLTVTVLGNSMASASSLNNRPAEFSIPPKEAGDVLRPRVDNNKIPESVSRQLDI